MPHDVIMPALGMAQDTGKLVAWLKAPGEPVAAGDPLFEVETDKATMEVEASHAGFLANVSAAAGDEVPVGHVVAAIAETTEEAAAVPSPAAVPDAGNARALAGREVIMPALGMAQDTGKLVAWLKAPGDQVAAGDPLFEVETDKSTMEVAADHAGWLAAVNVEAGAEVPVGEVIAVISAEQPDAHVVASAGPSAPRAPPPPQGSPVPQASAAPAPTPAPAPAQPAAAPGGPVLASPKARRLARERGIDIAALFLRGGGRPIHVADLDRLAAEVPATPAASAAIGAASRIEASVPSGAFDGFLGWLAREAAPAPAAGSVLAAFAAGALRDADGGSPVGVRVATPGKADARYSDPDLSTPAPAETAAAELVVRDLTASRITALALTAADAPVLTVARRGGALAITLDFNAQRMSEASALALADGFAARLAEPLRQLL